jgi:hypothetical protein
MPHLVVTSISKPNAVLEALADGATANGWKFHLIGDRRSPADFSLAGCENHPIESQLDLPFSYAKLCPKNSYARKNLGYLVAMSEGADVIIETDDDNFPLEGFWNRRDIDLDARSIQGQGWINAYRYFTGTFCYPRGFPLTLVRSSWESAPPDAAQEPACCPIQQGLANGQPDVDAVFRMLHPADIHFDEAPPIALGKGQWCPINSQNTTWFPSVYPLLYLPATCSFRATDIWRGLVAQRIVWANGWHVGFRGANVRQDRNDHDLLSDFEQELPVYRHTAKIADRLAALSLSQGAREIPNNLTLCYQTLVTAGWLDKSELGLIDAWLRDCCELCEPSGK